MRLISTSFEDFKAHCVARSSGALIMAHNNRLDPDLWTLSLCSLVSSGQPFRYASVKQP